MALCADPLGKFLPQQGIEIRDLPDVVRGMTGRTTRSGYPLCRLRMYAPGIRGKRVALVTRETIDGFDGFRMREISGAEALMARHTAEFSMSRGCKRLLVHRQGDSPAFPLHRHGRIGMTPEAFGVRLGKQGGPEKNSQPEHEQKPLHCTVLQIPTR